MSQYFFKDLSDLTKAIIEDNENMVLPAMKQNHRILRSKQLSIYIDGYIERLSKVIEADYPTLVYYYTNFKTRKEIGNIILSFIRENPSKLYNLDKYPLGFYDFFCKNSDDPFAKDLALLEYKIIEVFQAPDSEPLLPQSLANLSEPELENKIFKFRCASSLVEFDDDVEKFLSDFRNNLHSSGSSSCENTEAFSQDDEITISKKTYLFICRNNNEVKRNILDHLEFQILKQIEKGNNFADSLNHVISTFSGSETYIAASLQLWLKNWLSGGYFTK